MRNVTSSLLLPALVNAYAPETVKPDIHPQAFQAVEAALPSKARVRPRQERRLLIFTLCKGFPHESIPLGVAALEWLGAKTGAYDAVVSDDPAAFRAESLDHFDAVCMLNTTGSPFESAELKESLLEFVRSGKGIVGIHAATDCFYDWPAYGDMMGAYFDGHPWGAADSVYVKLDDPGHPLCAAFRGRGFSATEEIYQFKAPYSRDRLRVLLSLDMRHTPSKFSGVNRTDNDFAVSWVRSYGLGRVFQCSLGHNPAVLAMPAVLQHYLDGIQFALGDLPANTTPSSGLTLAYIEQSQDEAVNRSLNDWVNEIAAYDLGASSDGLDGIEKLLSSLPPSSSLRGKVVQKMATVLKRERATPAAKHWVCKLLHRFGSEKSVPYLAKLLRNDDTVEMALYALERMPTAAAGNALRKALSYSRGESRAAIVRCLGERRDARAVQLIAPLAADTDPALAESALLALGKIANIKAARALLDAAPGIPESLRSSLEGALIHCADQLVVDSDADASERIYDLLYGPGAASTTRARALRGLGMLRGTAAVPLAVEALECDDRIIKSTAASILRELSGEAVTAALVSALGGCSPHAKVLLLQALADRMDGEAAEAVTSAIGDANAEVRMAAITALARLGNAASVPVLTRLAGTGSPAESEAACKSLTQLAGEDVDAAIVAHLGACPPETRALLSRILAARYARVAVPALLEMLSDPSEIVRKQGYRSLGVLAEAASLRPFIESMLKEPSEETRAEAEVALVRAVQRVRPLERGIDAILDALHRTAGNVTGRCSLIRVLGEIGNDHGLTMVREAVHETRPEIVTAAIRALAMWRTLTPLDDLYAIAQHELDGTVRSAVLRGFVRLLGLPSSRTPEDTVTLYENAMALAANDASVLKAALAGLSEVSHGRALEVIKRREGDSELAADVATALQKVRNRAFLADTVWQYAGFTLEFRPGGGLTLNGDPENSWSVSDNTLVMKAKIGVIHAEIRDDKVFINGAEFVRFK